MHEQRKVLFLPHSKKYLCTTVQIFVVSTAISACRKKQQIKYKEKFLMKNRRLFSVFFWRMPRNIVGRLCLIKSEKFGVLIILRGEISQWGDLIIKMGNIKTDVLKIKEKVESYQHSINIKPFKEH